jgi:hypothetical protein
MENAKENNEDPKLTTTENRLSKLKSEVLASKENPFKMEAEGKDYNIQKLQGNPKFKDLITMIDDDKTFIETGRNTMHSYGTNTFDPPKGVFHRPNLYSSVEIKPRNVTKPSNIDLLDRISIMKSSVSNYQKVAPSYTSGKVYKRNSDITINYKQPVGSTKLSAKDDFMETLKRFYKINKKSAPMEFSPGKGEVKGFGSIGKTSINYR